jgi:alpha-methylacyl-CoA racemase
MRAPLDGFTVLDVGTLTPGKYASLLLADLGADVIRIERPQPAGPVSDEDLALNRNKRSMTMNLRSDAGRAAFLTLAERADVILESNRPGVADRNGVGYAAVYARNARIVYCALSGYGASGPQRLAPGYDLIFAAQCGMLAALTGRHPRPLPPDTYLADGISGLTAAHAIVAALLARERHGDGAYVDLAMHDSLFALLAVSHGVRRSRDRPASSGETPTYAVYPAAAGTWLALAAIRPVSVRALFTHLGRQDLSEPGTDPALIAAFLMEAFRAKPAEAWASELTPLDVEVAVVNAPLDAYDDEQLRARGMIERSEHPDAGSIETIRPALMLDRAHPRGTGRPAPRIGADTDAILSALGYANEAIAELHRTGDV